MLSAQGYKKPPVVSARLLLGNRENDSNLAGNNHDPPRTRTPAGSNGRPSFMARKKQFNEPASELDSETDSKWNEEDEEEEEEETDGSLSEENDAEVVKPAATRIVLKGEVLMQTLVKHS
jgi:hypothetical protein